ncbi:BRICHOS domain-containing protein 5 [Chanos chanos]|uniref:BRICHOS domain-containing protein 5 n=1 Tax=Chanos chanos TaxID=29144 RepID=A0A6J2VGD6_CHACN|nr:BRICHOS domain-containing protein 5 [Chanos chanos]
MVRCWKRSEACLEFSRCMDWGTVRSLKLPHGVFLGTLAAILLIVIIALGVAGQLGFQPKTQSTSQIVRITFSDQTGALINQSALVDKHNSVVTYSVSSQINHTSTVLFDMKHGLICYKPDNQDTCFLRKMEKSDYENMHVVLNETEQQVSQIWLVGNETQRHTEFLGVLAGSRLDASTLQEPIQGLCQDSPVYWTRRAEGPGKQRLIYFCIDICFPSNICVSVCFYYLPE